MFIVTIKWHEKQVPHGLAAFFPFHGDVFIYFSVPKFLCHDKLSKLIILSASANPERCVPERNSLNGGTCINLFLNPIYKNLRKLKGTEDQTQLWRPQCPWPCCEFHTQTKCGPKMWQQNCPTRQATSVGWNHFHLCVILRIWPHTQPLQYFMIAIPLAALGNASLS